MKSLFDSKSLRLIAAGLVVINGFFPAVWILLTSLKTEAELVSKPITYWPHNPTLANYVQAFTDQPLLKYLGNSLAVALSETVFSLIVSAAPAGSTPSRTGISAIIRPAYGRAPRRVQSQGDVADRGSIG